MAIINRDELHQRLVSLRRSPKLEGIFELYRDETTLTLKPATREKQLKVWFAHFAELGSLRLDRLSPLEVQKILLQKSFEEGHFHSVNYLARFVLQLADFAHAVGIVSANPLSSLLDLPLVKKAKVEEAKNLKHRPTLDYRRLRNELTEVIETFERDCCLRQRLLLEIQLRTILRPGEAVKININNLDLRSHLLTVYNTKTKGAFIIPCTESLELALLKAYANYGSKEGWVFGGQRNPKHHLSPQTLNKALKDHGFKNKLTAHGLRSVAANFFARNDSKVPPYVAEACLQHSCHNASVVLAYRRDDYLHSRKKAMRIYNDWLDDIYADIRS